MKTIEMKVKITIQDSIDSLDTILDDSYDGKEELAGVIESTLKRYIREEITSGEYNIEVTYE